MQDGSKKLEVASIRIERRSPPPGKVLGGGWFTYCKIDGVAFSAKWYGSELVPLTEADERLGIHISEADRQQLYSALRCALESVQVDRVRQQNRQRQFQRGMRRMIRSADLYGSLRDRAAVVHARSAQHGREARSTPRRRVAVRSGSSSRDGPLPSEDDDDDIDDSPGGGDAR